jgi:hypothetical protein
LGQIDAPLTKNIEFWYPWGTSHTRFVCEWGNWSFV